MRDPCPWCGLPGMALSRVDAMTRQIVRDIKDHNCPAWAVPPPLSIIPTDTTFIREGRNTEEGLAIYREYLRRSA